MTDEWELKVDGVIVDKWDEETIAAAVETNLAVHNMSENNVGSKGYLFSGSELVHLVLGAYKKGRDFVELLADGFTGSIADLNAVCHLDGKLFI